MSYNEVPVQNSKYIEDINSTTGQSVIGRAAVVYSLTVISDNAAAGVVTFHDGTSSTADHKHEIKIAASGVEHHTFPRGKRFDTAIFVKSNVAGLDLSIDYD